MASSWKYTDRVTHLGEGVYLWRQDIDRSYQLGKVRAGFLVCLSIDIFILILGAVWAFRARTPAFMIFAGICAAAFFLLSAIIFGLSALLVGSPGEIYTMTNTFMQTGSGNSIETFDYKKARKVTVTTRYIEMARPLKSMRVYVPHEDMSFVRNYILSRTGNAEVSYELSYKS